MTTLRAEMAGKDPGNREVMSTGTIALAASAAAVVSAEEVPPTTPIGNENISSSTVGASSAKDGRKGGSIDVFAGRRVSSGGRGSGTVKEGVRSGGVMAGVLRPLLDALDGARGHAATGAAAMKVRRENQNLIGPKVEPDWPKTNTYSQLPSVLRFSEWRRGGGLYS